MAICTKQFDVIDVGIPIPEPARPCVMPVARSDFVLRVDVVDVERADVGKTALNAFATKMLDKRQLPLPIRGEFLGGIGSIAMLVPMLSLALNRAKAGFCFSAAAETIAAIRPSRMQVALSAAELPIPSPHHVGKCQKRPLAALAFDFDFCRLTLHKPALPLIPSGLFCSDTTSLRAIATVLSEVLRGAAGARLVSSLHSRIVYAASVCGKYFDIACRRIEAAYAQPRLFEEPAPKPKQEALL